MQIHNKTALLARRHIWPRLFLAGAIVMAMLFSFGLPGGMNLAAAGTTSEALAYARTKQAELAQ